MEQISSAALTDKNPGGYKITFRKIARAAAAEMRVHKKLAIITYVLYGVAFVLFIFNASFYGSKPPIEFIPSIWGTVFAVLGILTTFFTALNVFRDTGNQQLCDVAMALPIKAVERFFSKLACLFCIQVAPLIVSVLGGNGLAARFGRVGHGQLIDAPEIVFSMFFIALASCLFIMSITVLSSCCCGALAESSYFSIIMMFIINGLPLAFVLNILNRSAGFSNFWAFDGNLNIDLGFWGFLFVLGDGFGYIISHAAAGCGVSIIVMLLSILIYKKRDARSVGTPISSKLFFELMMAGSCATVFSLAAMSSGFMWGVLIAGVAYIIISVIVSRAKINVLSFLKWAGKFALPTALFMAFTIACVKTGGFDYCRIRPDDAYLEGARFRINCCINGYADGVTTLYTSALSAEQADEVMRICKKHIVKGAAGVNAFDVIFDKYNSAVISVSADGDEVFYKRPSPKFMFSHRYTSGISNGDMIDSFVLDYYQGIEVSYAEMTALAEELKQLDYVSVEQRDPYYDYDYDYNDPVETTIPTLDTVIYD